MQGQLNYPCVLQAGYHRYQLVVQSQLFDFPMYRLAKMEVAALYPRIQEVALNCGYQACFKITNYCLWIETDHEDCRFVY
ncbi:hypothetical protein T4D_16999 [Trichinella pseudospiralis]|uniref:Uncharacterized protein n=1 Tax=Trichinella pseudospiralis TaxID=6337 RepID=A0A0V1FFI3_TRIPS|nr:hypothetical protein T4D_16999 [Trichinella pseudospiralis]